MRLLPQVKSQKSKVKSNMDYSLPGLRLPILFFLPLCPWHLGGSLN